MTDAERPGDDDLEVRLSWPDRRIDGPPQAPSAAREARAVAPNRDQINQLRQEFESEFQSQLARFQSLSKAVTERERRVAGAVDGALRVIADATTESLKQLGAEIAEGVRQLEEHSAAQQAEFTRFGEVGRHELKRVFTDYAGELDRLLRESSREMSEVVEQHVGDLEHSISASAAELNEIADQRFAEFNQMVTSHADAIQQATASSLVDVDRAVENRVGGLEQRVAAWAQARQAAFSEQMDGFAKQSRLTMRLATIAIVLAVIGGGIMVAVLVSR